MTIRQFAYILYRLDWMKALSSSVLDFAKVCYDDCKADEGRALENISLSEIFNMFGFDSERYSCYEKFLNTEYKDEKYMRALLNDEQYAEYLADIANTKQKVAI